MKFTCNINALGRTLRIVTGVILLADGVLMYSYDFPSAGVGSRILQVMVLLMGAFAIFEGAIGWCAIRALGVRTKF